MIEEVSLELLTPPGLHTGLTTGLTPDADLAQMNRELDATIFALVQRKYNVGAARSMDELLASLALPAPYQIGEPPLLSERVVLPSAPPRRCIGRGRFMQVVWPEGRGYDGGDDPLGQDELYWQHWSGSTPSREQFERNVASHEREWLRQILESPENVALALDKISGLSRQQTAIRLGLPDHVVRRGIQQLLRRLEKAKLGNWQERDQERQEPQWLGYRLREADATTGYELLSSSRPGPTVPIKVVPAGWLQDPANCRGWATKIASPS